MKIKTVFFLLLILSFGSCINKTPLTEEQLVYEGKWINSDRMWIEIHKDGTGDFTSKKPLESGKGNINKSFKGGKTTITNNQIKIDFFGIEETYNIDKPPYEENGKKRMQLNGLIFEKDNTHTLRIKF